MAQGELEHLSEELQSRIQPIPCKLSERFLLRNGEGSSRIRELLEAEPQSEQGMVFALSSQIPRGSQIYLGNSLPIREWDLAASFESRNYDVWASRGLNGIDGQVSTFLGYSRENCENWALIGDLTALYDLPGPWILPQMKPMPISICVMNNGGGKIFSRMFPHQEFLHKHQIRFRSWAELWGLKYEQWNEVPKQSLVTSGHRMIEMIPDEDATQRFWKKYEEICQKL